MIIRNYIIVSILLVSQSLFGQENSAELCGDGVDNDGDGLIDCFDPDCAALPNDGCITCGDGTSFIDTLLEYIPGCPLVDPDPQGAVGVSDWTGATSDSPEVVFLGQGGSIKLGFINNILTNSGDSEADLWIFEVGTALEAVSVELRPANSITENQLIQRGIPDSDADGYYEFGTITGALSSLDIDEVVGGFFGGQLRFDAVEIIDVPNGSCFGGIPGADIDAVCALSSISRFDCTGTLNGTAEVDDCGVCLEPTDPNFNSCLDCAGTPNGAAIVDDCGECLEPADSNFNRCLDCAGVANGLAVIDSCGKCLEPSDPGFNGCVDCAGMPNGTSLLDECGACLEPSDSNFNGCLDCLGIPYGLAVKDDCGECLTPSDPNFNGCIDCAGLVHGSAVIDDCGKCLELQDPSFNACVNDRRIFIPNAFSPNDDGTNDLFRIFKGGEVDARIKKYIVFDRWGELLYRASEFDFDGQRHWWNGEYMGVKLPPGTYLYYIVVEFRGKDTKSFAGDVTMTM